MEHTTLTLTKDELLGFASSLSQVTNIGAHLCRAGGPIPLTRDEFVALLSQKDTRLASLVGAWWDASLAVRAHVQERCSDGLRPADPFQMGPGGHVL